MQANCLLKIGDMYSKTVKANYSNGTCTTMQANCLLESKIEKTKQKPKQPLKLFSGLILISFFRSHFNSSCVLSLLH